MAIVRRCSRWTAAGLAALALMIGSTASGNTAEQVTVGASRAGIGDVTLEVYNGGLNAGGFEVHERGYASLVIGDAQPAPMIVQCSVTPTSSATFIVAETRRAAGTPSFEPSGRVFELPVSAANVIEFAVTPEHAGDHAYTIRPKDRTAFAIHTCTVDSPGASPVSSPPVEHPLRISPTRAVSGSGELALVEARFYKWLGREVVFDVDDVMILELGPGVSDPVVVRCQLDLDLAERTTFEVEIVGRQATISTVVTNHGELSFTLWGGRRARVSNPGDMWIWRSCELSTSPNR